MKKKSCTKCGLEKDLKNDFHRDTRSKDGRQGMCKVCHNAQSSEWYKNNTEQARQSDRAGYKKDPERVHKRHRIWCSNNPEKALVEGAVRRAKKKGCECTITHTDVVIPELCPVLGIPLIRGQGKLSNNSPTLDRLNNSKGYTKENVRVISWRANNIKGDATVDELRAVLRYAEGAEIKL